MADAGRPKVEIDMAALERAAAIGCTVDEIAALLGIAKQTMYNHIESDPALKSAIDRGRNNGKGTLRRLQWQGAEQGNPTMLIWLGKQMLGQRDKQELTGADGTPLSFVMHLTPEKKKEG